MVVILLMEEILHQFIGGARFQPSTVSLGSDGLCSDDG